MMTRAFFLVNVLPVLSVLIALGSFWLSRKSKKRSISNSNDIKSMQVEILDLSTRIDKTNTNSVQGDGSKTLIANDGSNINVSEPSNDVKRGRCFFYGEESDILCEYEIKKDGDKYGFVISRGIDVLWREGCKYESQQIAIGYINSSKKFRTID